MYIVVGGRSYLGSYLVSTLLESTNEIVLATYHNNKGNLPEHDRLHWCNLDVTSQDSLEYFRNVLVKLKARRAETETIKCIYVVGYIKPDDCLNYPEFALKVNISGLVNFIATSRGLIDSLVFTSTDFVFSESFNSYKYNEKDSVTPINLYGSIKSVCESIVLLSGFTVVRLPFMFGRSLINNRPHFIEHIDRVVDGDEKFEILSDYYESCLDYKTVSELIVSLFKKFDSSIPESIIHICGDEALSKYDIALRYAEYHSLPTKNLIPISLKNATFFKAKRATILMDNTLLKQMLGLPNINISFC